MKVHQRFFYNCVSSTRLYGVGPTQIIQAQLILHWYKLQADWNNDI